MDRRQRRDEGRAAMSRELRVGDRMRMSARSRVEDYPPGEKGVVRGGPKNSARSGVVYYLVAMDKDSPGQTTVFNAEEIEPDV